jgi:hypothetical protein
MRKIPLGNLNSNNPKKHLLKSIMQALPDNPPENVTDCWLARTLRLPTPMCISTAATSGADSRPEATHGGCLWNEMNYAPL